MAWQRVLEWVRKRWEPMHVHVAVLRQMNLWMLNAWKKGVDWLAEKLHHVHS